MTIRNTYAAESWDKVYSAFEQINFTSYDYDTVKESLLQYLKIYHAEHFNDFIESSELIAVLELFAYIAELLAYRIDTMSHENFITTAQRKQSILRLARLISYRASRNIPARGLVKIGSIRTTEDVYDSLGNNLANTTIIWNDPNNSNWKEQFFLVVNKGLTSKFGQPSKSFQIGDVLMQLYSFNNSLNSFTNGVFSFKASGTAEQIPMEAVPIDIDENGPYERSPDMNTQFNIVYAMDGKGDGSDYTGFLMFVKQGTLVRTDYNIFEPVANRRIELDSINVNDTDVWVYRVNDLGQIIEKWKRVETLYEQNVQFNDELSSRKKYEIETLENDRIALIFGDGNLSDSPIGNFQLWTRVSINQDITIPKNRIVDQQMQFVYVNKSNNTHQFDVSFSLTAAIQNNAASESIEHVRQSAPSTYYAQNRMVNGQDYNTYMLKDTTILRLKTINRTFAGQPKYIEWNDASQKYENVKLFGDDLKMFLQNGSNMLETSETAIIENVLEPILQSKEFLVGMTHIFASTLNTAGVVTTPRRKFLDIEKEEILNALNYNGDGSPKAGAFGLRFKADHDFTTSSFGFSLYDVNNKSTTSFAVDPADYAPANGLDYYKHMTEVITIEMMSDEMTFSVISNIRGKLPDYVIGSRWSQQAMVDVPIDFSITNSAALKEGSGFIVDITWPPASEGENPYWKAKLRGAVDLNGLWEVISDLTYVRNDGQKTRDLTSGPNKLSSVLEFNPNDNLTSWMFIIKTPLSGDTQRKVWYRDMKIVVESDSTKFWYNQNTQILDHETKKPVIDKIRILKSNHDPYGKPIQKSHLYDVTGFVYKNDGSINFNQLEVLPAGLHSYNIQEKSYLDNIMQFENFSKDSFEYFIIEENSGEIVRYLSECGEYGYEGYDLHPYSIDSYDSGQIHVYYGIGAGLYDFNDFTFISGSKDDAFDSSIAAVNYRLARRIRVPALRLPNTAECNVGEGLDFMWQHFSPHNNLIDPSVTNIHDAFILTRGYYNSVKDYVKGFLPVEPTPPSSIDLRTAYGYLLKNKMLSDTVILHSGKIKLLFGQKADQRFRAKFRIVKSPLSSYSDERIKSETLNVIDTFFDIQNWDFGNKFYATELLALIHQRLGSQIASAVLVPTYSVSYFGSLFTIDCGFDEILQSAATINDIEIVEDLTPLTLRQML